VVAAIMAMVATASIAMLSGHVTMPPSVSGVTIAPRRMPISTKQTRASGVGTCIWRPASAAIATASTEPGHQAGRNPEFCEGDTAGRGDQQGFDGRAE
jgi:hypothetical protein